MDRVIVISHIFDKCLSTVLIVGTVECPGIEKDGVHRCPLDILLDSVKWDDKGLAVAIAQHVDTGAVLMQGFANMDALASTISSKKATFYSRSRSKLWTKGETSMNYINVCDIFLDCDRDSAKESDGALFVKTRKRKEDREYKTDGKVTKFMIENIEKILGTDLSGPSEGVDELLLQGKSHGPTWLIGRCAKPDKRSTFGPTDSQITDLTTKIRQEVFNEMEEKLKQKVQEEVDEKALRWIDSVELCGGVYFGW
ncbi:hypothetical protein POM88_048537 [Heracleum sosnowskyi]|uniref:phosphoribosyl-AMP cyclohydrolase n=1 Tax=Heracleum sosnowskyi TaxID=360622 RepID=A0AAD8GVE3_9APIA|nr:hypothetical protein POM88_048537 [Heracleum sosnowskyi]